MQEVITYALTTMDLLARVTPKEDLAIYPPFRVINPLSADHEFLRTTLRASILQTVASNLRYQKGEMAIFETARSFQRPDERLPQTGRPFGEEAMPDEREHVTGAVTGCARTAGPPRQRSRRLLRREGVRRGPAARAEHSGGVRRGR